ncbi:hypothetical protein BC939DRAFT_23364 [Gamsiella multidivaricata]|uniref:uncharacterized protein n=1 Tax=Gamsiella multidivaricata TaxID=101098 RepID=UPI00221EBD5B|nr:uncharacterized protein BC939DRAFT_23364 [Gamsiella multidivaricata]KAI7829329.1 hypothetical protein BC939DRAFT_23364 [Gamsiella multidivaricata]
MSLLQLRKGQRCGRSFQQREEEPWLRYPDPQSTTRDYSRSSAASFSSASPRHQSSSSFERTRQDRLNRYSFPSHSTPQLQSYRPETFSISTTPSTSKHKRSLSKSNASPTSTYHHGETDPTYRFPQPAYRSSFSSRKHPQPRTLSEELSMALQQSPEDSLPSPITPSLVPSSPADMPSLSSSSSSSTLSSGHFPLFKPSFSSLQNQGSGGHQKPRPSPLSLHTSNTHGQEVGSGGVHLEGRASPSFSVRPSSPTSALSGDSTTATDIAGSPRAASATVAANLDGSSPLLPRSSLYQNNFGTMSSAASISDSSYYSNTSSPSTLTSPCSALCHHSRSRSRHHHPACQHHTDLQQSAPELESEPIVQHGPKPGRATKGVHRFGLPQFRPEIDDSHFGTVAIMKTTSTSTSGSGYGIQRASRDDDDYLDEPGTYEPPKKRLRSTASMLLDAAVETVIFTGAVALSAYQLLTGKGRLGHSKQSSMASNDADNATATGETSKAQEEDPMEEKLALVSPLFILRFCTDRGCHGCWSQRTTRCRIMSAILAALAMKESMQDATTEHARSISIVV